MNWLRKRIRRWLGLGETMLIADLGIYDDSVIIIASRFGGGRVKIITTKIHSMIEYQYIVDDIQTKYAIPKPAKIEDLPLSQRGIYGGFRT